MVDSFIPCARTLVPKFTETIESFSKESSTSQAKAFELVHTIPLHQPCLVGATANPKSEPISSTFESQPISNPSTEEETGTSTDGPQGADSLYILDSSFNPPTIAHLALAQSALHAHSSVKHRKRRFNCGIAESHDAVKDLVNDKKFRTNFHHEERSNSGEYRAIYSEKTPAPTQDSNGPYRHHRRSSTCRLLLLLSSHNADKQLAPASLPHRLTMMYLLAEELAERIRTATEKVDGTHEDGSEKDEYSMDDNITAIDIGLTTKPYFADKSEAIEQAVREGRYPGFAGIADTKSPPSSSTIPPPPLSQRPATSTLNPSINTTVTHTHIIGQDTLVRVFEPRYYRKSHDPPLSALSSFFDRHRLRVTARPGIADAGAGGENQSERIKGNGSADGMPRAHSTTLQKLASGALEPVGGLRSWARRIDMVPGHDGALWVSSTEAREAAAHKDWDTLRKLCPPSVVEWVKENKLYQ